MWKEIKQESKGCNASPEASFPVSNNSTYVSSVGICCCFPLLGTVAHPKVSCMKFSPFRRDHWAAPANWRNIACSKLGIRQSHLAAKHSRNFKALVWTCLNLTMDYGPWTMSCLNTKPGQTLNLLSVIMLLTGTTITWSSATAAGVHRHGHGWAAGGQCSTKTESPSLNSCQVQLERLVGGVFNSLKFEKKWDLLGQHHQGTHLKHEKCHRHCDNDNEFCHLKSEALSKQTPQKPNKQSLC